MLHGEEKRFMWFKQRLTDELWRNMLSRDSDNNDWKKNCRMSHGLFHELLNHLFPYIKYGMTKAFGCINGTHVPILRPIENSQDYYCYMMFF